MRNEIEKRLAPLTKKLAGELSLLVEKQIDATIARFSDALSVALSVAVERDVSGGGAIGRFRSGNEAGSSSGASRDREGAKRCRAHETSSEDREAREGQGDDRVDHLLDVRLRRRQRAWLWQADRPRDAHGERQAEIEDGRR